MLTCLAVNEALRQKFLDLKEGAIVVSLILIKRADRQRSGVSILDRLTDGISAVFTAGFRLLVPRRRVAP